MSGGAWDQDGSTIAGQQGRGAEAGNRIRWPWDETRKRSVPVYYQDAATAGTEPPGDGQDDPDVGTGDREGEEKEDAESGGEHALEYVGCFRDHPESLREYPGDAGYVFHESLTVNVRTRVLNAASKLSEQSPWT